MSTRADADAPGRSIAGEARAAARFDDLVLAQRIADGDRGALEALMRRYNQRLYRTARGILRDDAEAEDAVQEGYLHAWRAMPGFRGDAQLSTWLTRIVANEALMRLRRRVRRAEVVPLDAAIGEGMDDAFDKDDDGAVHEPRGTASPESATLRAEVRRIVEVKVDALPDAFRAVFVLRALEDMGVDEVAQALGIPAATVRTRYFRARGLLREALARELDLGLDDAFSFDGERCDRIVVGVLARLAAAGR